MYTPFSRETNRRLALFLIIFGVLLSPDITVQTPGMDLLLNVPIAIMLALVLNVAFVDAMMLTFVAAFLMIGIGLLIYPYNTKRLLMGRIHAGLAFVRSHPLMVLGAIILTLVTIYTVNSWFSAYEGQLKAYIMQIAQEAGVSI